MQVDLNKFINKNDVVAVATSGGSDSMALLHYLHNNSTNLQIKVVALNVEHGIRGQNSIDDTNFVKDYCKKNGIDCITYSVDCLKKAEQDKLSVEQAGRILRYECFYNAIETKRCTKVATAHHAKDNLESVLFNLFRGSGIKGLTGIQQNVNDKIIRPFLSVQKDEINEYVLKNSIPHVVDQTNFDDTYTRNYIRLNLLPQIEKVFPEAQKSVLRFCQITKQEDEYLDEQALSSLELLDKTAKIKLPLHKALFSRAVIKALNHLGIKKDWEKAHADAVFSLTTKENGASVDLIGGVVAVREYEYVTLYQKEQLDFFSCPFKLGKTVVGEHKIYFEKSSAQNLKDGLYFDFGKVPKDAVIRYKQDGDRFTKFGGGTKNLNDFLCDKKIPLRLRDTLPILASANKVLLIAGVAISNDIKVDETTKDIIKFTEEK